MGSIIETFHIDFRLLIAQAINFAIVFAVLYFFALKPLFKVMKERSDKIAKGLTDAAQIEERLRAVETERGEVIKQARKEALEISNQAQNMAEKKSENLINKAKEEIGQIINQEKAKMQVEKNKTIKEIKVEAAELIAAGLEKILASKLDAKADKEIIKKITR